MRLQSGVVRWLCEGPPRLDALALNVRGWEARDRADVAGVWFSGRGGVSLTVERSVLVVCCATREECWPECGTAEELVREVSVLHDKRELLQAMIRQEEPHLRADDVLFEDLAIWNYSETGNAEYHELERRLASLEQSLYRGSRLERLGEPPLADQLYVAVPSGCLFAKELREDWGLLWVGEDGGVELKRLARLQPCGAEARGLLVRRVLSAGVEQTVSLLEKERRKAVRKIRKTQGERA